MNDDKKSGSNQSQSGAENQAFQAQPQSGTGNQAFQPQPQAQNLYLQGKNYQQQAYKAMIASYKKRRPIEPMDKKDMVFMILMLIYSIFAVQAILFSGLFKLGFTLAYALIFVCENIYVFKKETYKPNAFAIVCGLMSVGASGVFAVYNDTFINCLLFCTIGILNANYFLICNGDNMYSGGRVTTILDWLKLIFYAPVKFFTEPFRSAFSSNGKRSKKTTEVLVGFAISVPILAVVVLLLMSSDAAFEGLINKIFGNIALTLFKVFLGVVIFPLIFAPMFAMRHGMLKKDNEMNVSGKGNDFRKNPAAAVHTVLIIISAVYLLYLFSQLAYFFSAFSGILPKDYTASSYARRGFFEMCGICALNVVFVAGSMCFTKIETDSSRVLSKVLHLFICVFSIVIIASSFSKMYLYMSLYGLTRKRVLTSIFMLMLACVFVNIIIRIFALKFPYLKVITVFCALLLIGVGYADIDKSVANYNLSAYESGAIKSLDGDFVNDLGDSAVDAIAKFSEKSDVSEASQIWLSTHWARMNGYSSAAEDGPSLSKSDTFLSYNAARRHSAAVLEKYNDKFDYRRYWKNADKLLNEGDGGSSLGWQKVPSYSYSSVEDFENDI